MPVHDQLPAPPRRLDAVFTPGQRWSTAIVLLLAVALAVAQPHVRGGTGGLFGSPSGSGDSTSSVSASTGSTPPAAPDLGATVVLPASDTGDFGGEFVVPPTPPSVVALVRGSDGTAPGRDDATIAAAFLEGASFQPTVMTIPEAPDATFCGQVAATGTVAITSFGGSQELRDCLAAAGVLLVGFDTLGTSSSVVSTRRGVSEALDDLTVWAKRNGAIDGKVGLVGTTAAKADVEAAGERMKAAGIDVVATAFVPDTSTVATETSDGARSFATAGVQTVVFAAPVAQQRAWAAQQSVLSPGARYVVADAYDAMIDEAYPATFEGSVALTSVRVAWFARDNGETPEQGECQTKWEQKAAPPTTLGSSELARVFAWCQHVALLAAALDGFSVTGGRIADVLRSVRFTSPLTSDIAPLPGGRWGPTQDAVVVWQADCACWKQKTAFAGRS